MFEIFHPHSCNHYSSFSVSTSSSLTSNPCSFIELTTEPIFCMAWDASPVETWDQFQAQVLLLLILADSWNQILRKSFRVNCDSLPPFDPISISMLNSVALSPCCFTESSIGDIFFAICDALADTAFKFDFYFQKARSTTCHYVI